ncbi:hypothetical protein HMPREF0083_02964 [Aneurinibacillus aneurinilyticus ATCC 12856]|uniref:Uncharacterized protein n=1 Tax=Aneurinibacillus aneurinilyticus ATCC 12856 TaxID=649747 RepID=U1YDV6_ANEAE|nr:hypothetical protein HMPREF0083_02964 [Aneurinibacillus aneurinilyticus ATCC 12856]
MSCGKYTNRNKKLKKKKAFISQRKNAFFVFILCFLTDACIGFSFPY